MLYRRSSCPSRRRTVRSAAQGPFFHGAKWSAEPPLVTPARSVTCHTEVGTFAPADLILDDLALNALNSTESRESATGRFMSDGYDLPEPAEALGPGELGGERLSDSSWILPQESDQR
jgi:hypothetical protein